MEISWDVGLKDKAEQLVKKKMAEKNQETTWEQHLADRREKRKAKKQEKKLNKQQAESDEEVINFLHFCFLNLIYSLHCF